MSNPKPYSGTSASRLTALVNRFNATALVYGLDITFNAPRVYTGVEEANTTITVIPLRNPGRYLAADVDYSRLPIDALDQLPAGFVKPVQIHTVPFSTHGILPRINEALGLDLVPSEVENVVFEESQDTYTLTIKEGSLCWLPSSIEFLAEHVIDVPLSSIITVTTLNGLTYSPQ